MGFLGRGSENASRWLAARRRGGRAGGDRRRPQRGGPDRGDGGGAARRLPGGGDLGRRRRLRGRHRRAGDGGRRPGRQPRQAPRQGRQRHRRRRGGAQRRAGAGAGPALRRRPRRLGGAAGAAGRGGRGGGVRPRRRRLRAAGRRRLRHRPRLRPLGDPPPLRLRGRGADLRPAGAAGRGPAGDAAVRRRLRDGDRDDGRRGPRRLPGGRVRARPRAPGDGAHGGGFRAPRPSSCATSPGFTSPAAGARVGRR